MVAALSGDGYPQFLQQYRQGAWEIFESLPIPTTSDEAWRRTDLRGLDAGSFRLPAMEDAASLPAAPAELLHPIADEAYGGQVLLLPGEVQASLDPALAAKGVIFTDLVTAERQHPQTLERVLGQVVRPDEGKFAALAGALAQTGVLLYVPRGVQVEQPLHSILWGPGAGLAYISHLLVWVDDGASLTYVHEAASPTEVGWSVLACRDRRDSRWRRRQPALRRAAVLGRACVELQPRARTRRAGWQPGLDLRGDRQPPDQELLRHGPGWAKAPAGVCRVSTSPMATSTWTTTPSKTTWQPHTTSDLLFKGALKDHSRSVWQGMIYVAPGAQKTDGYQANRNLILSPKARANSIPGLEILADDVRCTHGATVGKIDPELVFYLRAAASPGRTLSAWSWKASSTRSCSASPSKACASVFRMRFMGN